MQESMCTERKMDIFMDVEGFSGGDDNIYEVFKRMNKFSYCSYFLDTNPTEILYDEWKIKQLTEIL